MNFRVVSFHFGVALAGLSILLSSPEAWSAESDWTQVLIYGDAGDGSADQAKVGRAMAEVDRKTPFDFAVSTGDNMYVPYSEGVFQRVFENPYRALIERGVAFFQTVGNHDMEGSKLRKQLEYSQSQDALRRGVGGWVLPNEDYVFERERSRWIVLNVSKANGSLNWSKEREEFLTKHACQRKPEWTFLVVHYPLWSTNTHGDNRALARVLLPILERCPVDMVFSGHDHHGEYMHPWRWIPTFVVGHGHEIRRISKPSERESLFRTWELGFARLSLKDDVAKVGFVDSSSKVLFEMAWQKRVPAWIDVWKLEDQKLFSRVQWPSKSAQNDLQLQIGISKTSVNPVFESDAFEWRDASFGGRAEGGKGYEFSVPVALWRDSAVDLGDGQNYFVASRVKAKERGRISRYQSPWIYGDLSEGQGLHGNYDGIQAKNLLEIRL